ncbi:MAG: efflux transporter outer membrane subunit [Pseudomonadota bacterium]
MRTLTILVCLALMGCAQYAKQPDLPALTEPALPEPPTAWQTAQQSLGEVEVGWIAEINDPALLALVSEAQQNNRNLQAAEAGVRRAFSLVRQARAALLPGVNYSAAAAQGGRVADSASDNYSSGLSLNWELDIWGRVRASRNAAQYSAESAQADFVFAQYSLAAAVAQAYFVAIEAALLEEVSAKSLNALQETVRIVESQREVGAADAFDEFLAAANLATGKATLAQAQGAELLALRALEVLLGRYPAADLATPDDLPEVPATPKAGVPSELLERRPDIIAAQLSVASAFSDVGAAKAARLPALSLSSSLDITAPRARDAFKTDNGTCSIAAAILGPLFDAGLRRAQVEAASATQEQAIANYTQIALQAFQEVEDSLDQNLVLARRVNALEEAAVAQNRAFNLAQLRYEEGETNLLDVLTIQSDTLAADSNLVSARRQQLDEWVRLNLALGGHWDTP